MDAGLVVRAQRGDLAAFERLAEPLYAQFQRVAYRILRDPALAEDAAQEAVMNIWRHLPGLRDPSRFEAWSYRLLVNACHGETRRRRASLPNVMSVEGKDEAIAGEGLGGIVARDQLERGFRRLSVEHRAVIVLRLYLDLSADTVASALGIPVGTVNSRLHRAMRLLRGAIEGDEVVRPLEPIPPEVAL
jgi:RNA polymerase sigma-70 factor (ECF subfamily)